MKKVCENCVFFESLNSVDICKRFPPVPVMYPPSDYNPGADAEIRSLYPEVGADWDCGEFKGGDDGDD